MRRACPCQPARSSVRQSWCWQATPPRGIVFDSRHTHRPVLRNSKAAGILTAFCLLVAGRCKQCDSDALDENFRILSPDPDAVIMNRTVPIVLQIPCCIVGHGLKLSLRVRHLAIPQSRKDSVITMSLTRADCVASVETFRPGFDADGAWRILAQLHSHAGLYDERIVSIHVLESRGQNSNSAADPPAPIAECVHDRTQTRRWSSTTLRLERVEVPTLCCSESPRNCTP